MGLEKYGNTAYSKSYGRLSNITSMGGICEAITPKQWRLDALRQEMLNWLRAKGREANDMYRVTVATWSFKHRPTFRVQHPEMQRGAMVCGVTTGVTTTGRSGKATTSVDRMGKEIQGPSPAQIYSWVDFGTKPHRIPAVSKGGIGSRADYEWKTVTDKEGRTKQVGVKKSVKKLVFDTPWQSKTTAGQIASGPGYRGKEVRKKDYVTQHIEPRRFSAIIQKNMQAALEREVSSVVERALRKAGMKE
jgi:hypothetical protein